jgi:predicted nucleic acid-binding protein
MASKVLPDTCAWIDFFRGRPTRQAELVEAAILAGEVCTCGVVLYELLQGIRNPAEEASVLNAFQGIPQLEMSAPLWVAAGQLSARLRGKGHTLPLSDIIIAVLALEHGCSIVTIDRHFAVIPGLDVVYCGRSE